jgi:nucleoside-diphosphate-sugar epimerase
VKTILITGAGGIIGGVLFRGLAEDYSLRGLDRTRLHGVDSRKADMTRLRRIQPAFEGADGVVHLAANASVSASWEVVYRNNLPATMNMLEAARRAGVERVVLASSSRVTGLYERDEPYASILAGAYDGLDPRQTPRITADLPIRPDGPYGIGKALGEAAGRYYSEELGLSVICLRIGTVTQSGQPKTVRHRATMLSHRDLLQLVRSCIEAPPELRFGIYYGVSANRWRIWDIEAARSELGYKPCDDFSAWQGGPLSARS